MSRQTASDMAMICKPGSMMSSTSSLLSRTRLIDQSMLLLSNIEGYRAFSWGYIINISLIDIRDFDNSLFIRAWVDIVLVKIHFGVIAS
jgi:hypothetical protein